MIPLVWTDEDVDRDGDGREGAPCWEFMELVLECHGCCQDQKKNFSAPAECACCAADGYSNSVVRINWSAAVLAQLKFRSLGFSFTLTSYDNRKNDERISCVGHPNMESKYQGQTKRCRL